MPRSRSRRVVLGVVACTVLASGGAPPAAAARGRDAGFVVVVHEENPVASLPRAQVARLFLRKVRRWPDGAAVLPVDLAPDAPARAAFSGIVMGKSVASVRAYWQARIFSGRDVPPPEKASEADALAHVRAEPAAVGYVSDDAVLPPGVRVLHVAP